MLHIQALKYIIKNASFYAYRCFEIYENSRIFKDKVG